jgi:hypothetical protein
LEKITYRRWSDCYLISNGTINLVINASAGGRIMVYERNRINIIYEDPEQDGLLLDDYRNKLFDPDGGRFDYGQTNIFYTNKIFAEMEPISPAAFLEPGEEYIYEEDLYILEYPPCSEPDFNVLKATGFIQSEIKEI